MDRKLISWLPRIAWGLGEDEELLLMGTGFFLG
jgi:hypothetical protein